MKEWLWVIISVLFIITGCSDKRKFDSTEDEPLFAVIDLNDATYKKTVEKAQSEIDMFQKELDNKPETSNACVKIKITDNQKNEAFVWLNSANPRQSHR